MSIRSTSIALDHCVIGSTKPPTKTIGIRWSPAFFIPARHYQNTQKHGDHSHPGTCNETPAADARNSDNDDNNNGSDISHNNGNNNDNEP